MEARKNPKADLERRTPVFFQIGLVIALTSVLYVLEIANPETVNSSTWDNAKPIAYQEEMIPITYRREAPAYVKPKSTIIDPAKLVEMIVQPIKPETKLVDLPAETPAVGIENLLADPEDEGDGSPLPWSGIQVKPEYPGGMDELFRFIGRNLRYPLICQELGIKGTVIISFIIDKTGKVTGLNLIKGVDRNLDQEAMRVVAMMPDWKPGFQNGRPVSVSFQMPIRFQLD